MFTSVHSAVAKFSAKLSPRPAPSSPIRSRRENPTQLYKPKFRKGLVKRLRAIKTQRTILGRIQGMGLRALGQFLYSINLKYPLTTGGFRKNEAVENACAPTSRTSGHD
jgi:hypothetical protein